MPKIKHHALKTLTAIENRYDAVRFKRRQRRGLGRLQIVPYIGYGTEHVLILKGRVLRDKAIREAMDTASAFENLVDMYKRFASSEIPGATVQATFLDTSAEAKTNVEGFFEFRFEPASLPPVEGNIHLIDLQLSDYPGKAHNPVEPAEFKAQGQVIVPPADAQFAVISDVDDTVMFSNVAHILSLVRNTFLENARTRLPFEGVAKFYQALRRGESGAGFNPIFYVSNSAWNIYDLLHDFFVLQDIPLGAMFLSEINLDEETFLMQNIRKHKIGAIETLLSTYASLPFILIGDSSEKDPIIYHEIAQKYPDRIAAIYIRTATLSRKRDASLQALVQSVEELGIPMVLAGDSYQAAQHAASHGFIHPDALPAIREARNEDRSAPTPVQQALNLPPAPTSDPNVKLGDDHA